MIQVRVQFIPFLTIPHTHLSSIREIKKDRVPAKGEGQTPNQMMHYKVRGVKVVTRLPEKPLMATQSDACSCPEGEDVNAASKGRSEPGTLQHTALHHSSTLALSFPSATEQELKIADERDFLKSICLYLCEVIL